MSTSRKLPAEQPPLEWRQANSEEALKLIQGWLETDENSDDTSDWEKLKRLLDEDRLTYGNCSATSESSNTARGKIRSMGKPVIVRIFRYRQMKRPQSNLSSRYHAVSNR